MEARINDKITQINEFLEELEPIIPQNFEDYLNNHEKRAACERYAEKIIKAIVDLTFLVIKFKKFEIPKDEESSFFVLSNHKIISEDLAKRMKEAKGMRNILAHKYDEVDDEIVHNSVANELIRDVTEFINKIQEILK